MKAIKYLIFLVTSIFLISCSNPNQHFIDKLILEAGNNELGIDLNYKVIEFEILDTLFNSEHADSLQFLLKDYINELDNIDMSKEVFTKLRNQELEFRDRNYYKDVVFNKNYNSEWITELRQILHRTDSIINDFDNANILVKFELYTWYKQRYFQFNMDKKNENRFISIHDKNFLYQELEKKIDSLMLNPDSIIHYETKVKFEQISPELGGLKQKLTEIRYFDKNIGLIKNDI